MSKIEMAGVDVVTVDAPISSFIESLPKGVVLSPVHNPQLEQALLQIINGTIAAPLVEQNIFSNSLNVPTTDHTEDNKIPLLQAPNDNGGQILFPSKHIEKNESIIPVINHQLMLSTSQELTQNETLQTPVDNFDNSGQPLVVLSADNPQRGQELSQIVTLDVIPEPSTINQTQINKEQIVDQDPCNNQLEQALLQAVTANNSQVTPLIKDELRSKIKFRRKLEGLQEIKVEFKPPPKYELRPEEVLKMEARKKRNRHSAHVSREKRKSREKYLEKMVEDLEREKDKRTKIVEELRDFEGKLRSRFADHLGRCNEFKIKRLLQMKTTLPG